MTAAASGSMSCATCGAHVADPVLHAAWHRREAPLVAVNTAGEVAEVLDEVLFQLRRTRREGLL